MRRAITTLGAGWPLLYLKKLLSSSRLSRGGTKPTTNPSERSCAAMWQGISRSPQVVQRTRMGRRPEPETNSIPCSLKSIRPAGRVALSGELRNALQSQTASVHRLRSASRSSVLAERAARFFCVIGTEEQPAHKSAAHAERKANDFISIICWRAE